MFKLIYSELRHHIPFTIFGAIMGVVMMLFFRNMSFEISYKIFYIFHPTHVFLSAFATTSMYRIHKREKGRKDCNIFILLAIGYVGAVGIATLSDSIIPYFGEVLLKMPHRHVHVGFIEHKWLISLSAIVGIGIAYFKPITKFSHFFHVLLSTCASLFHIIMAAGSTLMWFSYIGIFVFLFIAVWIPCCLSDIIFPLLFVKNKE